MNPEKWRFDAAVIGNIGIDTSIFLPRPDIDWAMESNFTENLDCLGQAGGYSARGFARLGYRTAFVGTVGDDHNGKFILDELHQDGINTAAVFIDPEGTARSINLVFPDGRRKNFYDGKSHMHLSPDFGRPECVIKESRLAHFNIPNWARHLLATARKNGVMISCDLQDLPSVDDPYRQDFILGSDIVFFSSANVSDPESVVRALIDKNPKLVVVCGMGDKGCAAAIGKNIQYCGPVELDEPVVDTNGAGDGLAVGFLSSYVFEGMDLERSLLRGQIAARYTCSRKADTSQLIQRPELDRWAKVLANAKQSR
jgi:sugar/nucleoside kinase (ribokinase family)